MTQTTSPTDPQPQSPAIRIMHLADVPHLAPILARWTMETWGHLNPERTLDDLTADFTRRAARNTIPQTLVAVTARAGHASEPVGMASLVQHDLTTRPDLTPWMAAVFVAPAARGQGIGSRLVQAVVAEARSLGVPRLYLLTPDQQRLYSRLGWEPLFDTEYRGELVTVMQIAPDASAD